MDGDERLYALAFMAVPGLGPRRLRRLRDRFARLEAAWHAAHDDLRRISELPAPVLAALERARRGPSALDHARRQLETLEAEGIHVHVPAMAPYPDLLAEIPDPPAALFVKGSMPPPGPKVAVVGTRAATAYGLRTARRLSAELAACGVTVVSGLAIGIDAAAHAGALETGLTAAVLGAGLDHVSPRRNLRLAEQILASGGALISEYPPTTPAAAGQFPARNRIVSGMCHATVVVEAPLRSGALITADLALEQGREVMAVPGQLDQPQSAGTLQLLSQGAKLVTGVEDILCELPLVGERVSREASPPVGAGLPAALPPDEARVLRAVGTAPRHVDQIVAATGLPTAVVTGLLLVLELKAFVVQLPGNHYIRHA